MPISRGLFGSAKCPHADFSKGVLFRVEAGQYSNPEDDTAVILDLHYKKKRSTGKTIVGGGPHYHQGIEA